MLQHMYYYGHIDMLIMHTFTHNTHTYCSTGSICIRNDDICVNAWKCLWQYLYKHDVCEVQNMNPPRTYNVLRVSALLQSHRALSTRLCKYFVSTNLWTELFKRLRLLKRGKFDFWHNYVIDTVWYDIFSPQLVHVWRKLLTDLHRFKEFAETSKR